MLVRIRSPRAEPYSAALNTRAAFNEAFPGQYAAATSGQITTAGQKSWAGIFLSTGAFPSTVLLGQVEGCLEGNPAACLGASDFQFFGLMGDTDSFYTGYFGKLPVK